MNHTLPAPLIEDDYIGQPPLKRLLAHRPIGTFSDGAVRFSLELFNTETDITTALHAVRELAVKPEGDMS